MGRHIFLSCLGIESLIVQTGQQNRSIFVKPPYTNGVQQTIPPIKVFHYTFLAVCYGNSKIITIFVVYYQIFVRQKQRGEITFVLH